MNEPQQEGSEDAAREIKVRLRAGLRAAMKDRNASEVKVLRTLIAAIDNAEAPPFDAASKASDQARFSSGSAEVDRLLLGGGEVLRTIAAEVQELERGAAELEQLGLQDRSEALRAEARIARRYLDK